MAATKPISDCSLLPYPYPFTYTYPYTPAASRSWISRSARDGSLSHTSAHASSSTFRRLSDQWRARSHADRFGAHRRASERATGDHLSQFRDADSLLTPIPIPTPTPIFVRFPSSDPVSANGETRTRLGGAKRSPRSRMKRSVGHAYTEARNLCLSQADRT